jgi:hypothetical protein
MPDSKNFNLNSSLTCILRVFSIYHGDLKLCSIVLEVRFSPSGLDREKKMEYNNQAQLSGSSP